MHCYSPLTPTVFLERAGKVFPEATAIQDHARTVAFRELLHRSRQLAGALSAQGVRYGDRVAFMSENCQQAIEANFGIPGAGGVIASLNHWLPTEDLLNQLRLVDSHVLIVSRSCLAKHGRDNLSERGSRLLIAFGEEQDGDEVTGVLDYERALAGSSGAHSLDTAVRDEMDPIVINFTSGTTGTPKGVVMSHRASYLHAVGQALMLRLSPCSRYFWSLPMFHVNGWGHMWANLVTGTCQIINELPRSNREDEARFVDKLCRLGVTHLAGAPRLLRSILALEGAGALLKGCTVVTGGAAPSRALLKELDALGAIVIHQYGLNETFGPYVVCEEQPAWRNEDYESRAVLRSRQGVATIHAGTGLRVLNADGQPVTADGKTAGEVVVAGNTVSLGYYGAPEATAKAFMDGWFHTGDLAVIHPDGYLEIKDRIKDQIYVETDYGWENISSLEVERVLTQCTGVEDAALLGVPIAKMQDSTQLVAVIEARGGAAPSLDQLREHCEKCLPVHMRPTRFVLSSIPKTATGKTRKDLLLTQALREVSGTS